MRAAFLLERRYAPYSKWFGTAFGGLGAAASLTTPLRQALAATDFPAREEALVQAYELLARLHNTVLPECAAEPTVRLFHTRISA